MSLKCSILGHRFEDPVVERSRDESGSEVVITIQEIQTCGRCSHEQVVSENKEVTTLETPDDAAEVDAADEPAAPDEPTAPDEPAVPDEQAAPEPEPTPTREDDATVIEGEDPVVEEAEPEAPTAGAGVAGSVGATDEADDDGIILEEASADDEADREPGQWPQEPEDDGPGWEPPTEPAPAAEPDPDPGPSVEPAGEAVTVPEGTFRCPSCGFTTPVEASSLREGDFCPECHTGTLAHERD